MTPTEIQQAAQLNRDQSLALAQKLPLAERQAMLGAALQALPKCWGLRSSNCSRGAWDGPTWPAPQCQAIAAGYIADWDQFDAAVEKVPYCDEKPATSTLLLAAGAGVVLGIVVSKILF